MRDRAGVSVRSVVHAESPRKDGRGESRWACGGWSLGYVVGGEMRCLLNREGREGRCDVVGGVETRSHVVVGDAMSVRSVRA